MTKQIAIEKAPGKKGGYTVCAAFMDRPYIVKIDGVVLVNAKGHARRFADQLTARKAAAEAARV